MYIDCLVQVQGLVKQVLIDVDDRQIAVMQNFGEYVGHKRVHAVHEIVENQERRSFSVENFFLRRWKSFLEVYKRSVLLKHWLIFPVTLHNAFDR